MTAGLDDISIFIPRLCIDSKDFASFRDLDPDKLEKGLGVSQMAIVDSNQDPACMASNACLRLLQKNNLKPTDIGRLYISTESSFDESKAMNSYVIGMLEQIYGKNSFEHCGGVETKFACVSGSYALYDNTNWIRAGESGDQHAIVVVSDIAKYDMGSSGEMTQGAGAVAMLLNNTPRLLEFDPRVTATSITDEYDFYRPFGKETPIVHGQYSSLLYLLQIRNALEIYKKRVAETGLYAVGDDESILDHIDYLCMHLPYANMGKKALAYLLRHEWRNLSLWPDLIKKIGMNEPPMLKQGTIESILHDTEFMKQDHEFTKRFTATDEYKNLYESKMASTLIASSMIGNLYTASLYLGFRSCLEFEFKKGVDLVGKRVGFGSYGSGSSAMIFSGLVQDDYKQIVSRMNLLKELGQRVKLNLQDYESLHENKRAPDNPVLDVKNEFILVDINNSVESRGERRYIFAS